MKTVGYVVEEKKLINGVLWWSNTITLFPTLKAARKAIKDTAVYEKKHGYTWGTEAWRIARITAPPKEKK
jgi:hypothetical protein